MAKKTRQLDRVKLRHVRLNAGLTQAELAPWLGVSKQQVANIENGLSGLDANGVAAWCAACGVENAFDLYSHPAEDHEKALVSAVSTK